MQIHELTKRRKTNEGLLDTVKSAIKTGAKKVADTVKTGFDPAASAVKQNQKYLDQANQYRQDIAAKYGPSTAGPITRSASELYAGQNKDVQIKQQAQVITKAFMPTPEFAELAQILPDFGQVLTIEVTQPGQDIPAQYYKDVNGTWYNETGDVIPADKTTSLEAKIDKDQYSQTVAPAFLNKGQAAVEKQKKTKKSATPVTTPVAADSESLQEAAGLNRKKLVALQKAQNFVVNKADATATAREYKTTAQQANKNPATSAKIKRALAQLNAVSNSKVSGKKKKVAQAFQTYTELTLQSMKDIGTGNIETEMLPSSPRISGQAVQQTATKEIEQYGIDPAAITQLQKIAKNPKLQPTVKNAIGLSESQVAITKDIRVKTTKGDYVKRHEDQQWYDPNGVLIDPEKYVDYIKKLDATPAAQTRYQADAEKGIGSDISFLKGKAAAKNKPNVAPVNKPNEPVDPLVLAAKQQELRAQNRDKQVQQINSQIQQTMTDLRNAEIFDTGQATYLRQQIAQLMAIKA